jgi:MOSC domain-containing protein YiiM
MSDVKLVGIALRSESRAVMEERQQITITTVAGLEGDFRGSNENRQVSVLSSAAWQAVCDELGQAIPWTVRRANLLVEGLEDFKNSTGTIIRIGAVELQVNCETDPCSRMDEQVQGLSHALEPDWRGGVCCSVLQGGDVQVGDEVQVRQAD